MNHISMHDDEAANPAFSERHSPNQSLRRPDFIIGGAPKCGTTSLHFILDQHPDVAVPNDEVHFFDADDPVSHPDFLRLEDGALKWWDPGSDAEDNQRWYAERFGGLGAPRLIGEDSTTYLMSEVAAKRIAAQLPDVKVIFMLRHPVRRAYSQYWHLVKTSRAVESFEQALMRHPQIMLGSSYAAGLKRFFDALGRHRVHICFFEDFRADIQGCVDEVTSFLGLDQLEVDPERAWFNRTKYSSCAAYAPAGEPRRPQAGAGALQSPHGGRRRAWSQGREQAALLVVRACKPTLYDGRSTAGNAR